MLQRLSQIFTSLEPDVLEGILLGALPRTGHRAY